MVFDSNSPDTFITILDNKISPIGFSYLFIVNGRGTVGTAILKDFNNIHYYSEAALLRLLQIENFNMENIKSSVSPVNFFVPKTAKQDGKLFVGEAAGFQDYLFGLGIRMAIKSGYLAAESIINNTDY